LRSAGIVAIISKIIFSFKVIITKTICYSPPLAKATLELKDKKLKKKELLKNIDIFLTIL
jgi:hypothetical protein